ncbi:hypothetical protein RyT2_17580 [Pseudolactococcus yaeyamensis]
MLEKQRIIEQFSDKIIEEENSRFFAQGLYLKRFGEEKKIQKRLESLRIVIIGAGALGSNLCVKFSAMGCKNIVCIDADKVEVSNLTRQIYYTDLQARKECYKVDALAKFIFNFYPESNFLGIKEFVSSDNLGTIIEGEIDLIVNTADSPQGKIDQWVSHFAVEFNIPLITSHYQNVGPLYIPKSHSACWFCLEKQLDKETEGVFSKVISLSNNAPNTRSASFVTGELMNEKIIIDVFTSLFISEEIDNMINKYYTFSSDNYIIKEHSINKNVNCTCN